eukprot:COSAG03_NODE_13783_length_488_cov_2.172237_2_plen_62_part_01
MVSSYPTLLELAKVKRFDGHDIDGHSLVPLLDGSAGLSLSVSVSLALSVSVSLSLSLSLSLS